MTLDNVSVADLTVAVRSTYTRGYAIAIGIFNFTQSAMKPGCSVSLLVYGRRSGRALLGGLNIAFQAVVSALYLAAAQAASQTLTSLRLASSFAQASTGVVMPSASQMAVHTVVITTGPEPSSK